MATAVALVSLVTPAAADALALAYSGGLPVATNGQVLSLVRSGTTLYIAGRFTRVGPTTGGVLALDRTTGTRRTPTLSVGGSVDAIVPDGNGGYYLGGNFSSVDGTPESNLAHLTSTGALDPAFSAGTDAPVLSLALSGSTLFLGGQFLQVDQLARSHFAAVSATTGAALSLVANVNGDVRALLVQGTVLYVAGHFGTVAGTTRPDLAALSTTDLSLIPSFAPSPDGAVDALAGAGAGSLFAGGEFQHIGGSALSGLAKLSTTDGSAVTTFTPNADGAVDTLLPLGGRLYAGGTFANIGGLAAPRLASLDPVTGSASSAFAPAPDGRVAALAPGAGGTVLAGGEFTQIGGQTQRNLGSLDPGSGAATPGYGPQPDRTVAALAVSDDGSTVMVGGDFVSAGGDLRHNVAAIDLTTGTVTGFDPDVEGANGQDSYVRRIALSGGRLWLGGQFSTVGGAAHADLAAVDPTTGTAIAADTDTDGVVQALADSPSGLLVGGNFQTIDGVGRSYLARLNGTTGALDSGFAPQPNYYVYALAVEPSGTIVLGGQFNYVNNSNHNELAALNSDGSLATAFQPDGVGANDYVDQILPVGSSLYVSGQFNSVEGDVSGGLIGLDGTSGAPLSGWTAGPDLSTYDVAAVGSAMFATGCFRNWAGESLSELTGFDPATGVSFDPGFDLTDQLLGFDEPGVGAFDRVGGCGYSLASSADGSTLYVGGLFSSVQGAPQGGITSFAIGQPAAAGGGGAGQGGGSGNAGGSGAGAGAASVDPNASSAPPLDLSAPSATTASPDVSSTGRPGVKRGMLDTGLAAGCPAGGSACTVRMSARTEPSAPDVTFTHAVRRAKGRPRRRHPRPRRRRKPIRSGSRAQVPIAAGSRTVTVPAGRQAELTFALTKGVLARLRVPGEVTLRLTVVLSAGTAAAQTIQRTIILEGRR